MAAAVTVYFLRGSRRKASSPQPVPSTTVSLRPPLLSNAQSFYGLTVIADGVILAPLLSNAVTFYSATVSRNAALIMPLVSNSQSFPAPSVKLNVTVGLLTVSQAFPGAQVITGHQIAAPLLSEGNTFYGGALSLNITPSLLTNTVQLFAPTALRDVAINPPLLSNSQTFYRPVFSLNLRAPLLTNSIVIRPPSVNIVSGGYTLSTPVVTLTTAAGAIPEVDITMGADIYAGFTLRIQRSATGTKNVSDGSYSSPTLNITHQIAADEIHEDVLAITNASLASDGYTNPSGTYYQQYRWEREDGAISGWSNEITDTVTAASTTLYYAPDGTGTNNKNRYIKISGTPYLIATGTSGVGAPQPVRATSAKTGKKQFEVTVTTVGDNYLFLGVEDGMTNLDSGFPAPGITNALGVALRIRATSFDIWKAGVAIVSGVGTVSNPSLATGDVLTATFDTSAATMSFYRTRSGSTVQIGSTVTGIGLGTWQAFLGPYSGSVLTANFGQSAFTRALDTGYAMYG